MTGNEDSLTAPIENAELQREVYDSSHYEEVMLNCLKIGNWRKKEAIKLFRMHFGWHLGHITQYAYVVYERVVKKYNLDESSKVLYQEFNNSLRAMMDIAVQKEDFSAFEKMAGLVLRANEKKDVNVSQTNIYNSQAPVDVIERINKFRSKHAFRQSDGSPLPGATGVGGVRQNLPGQSTVDVPVSSKAGDGPPVAS